MVVTRNVTRRFTRSQPQAWETWSYSKLRAYHECALKFLFQYVYRLAAPQAPILTVGSALHYLVFRFFRTRYQSAETFCSAWKHFWIEVAEGRCGPNGYRSPAVQIAWKSDKERYYWLQEGVKILTRFFERHADHRGTGIARLAEARFSMLRWRGFFLNGTIDRLDEHSDHAELVDYKMGVYPPYMLHVKGSHQATFYQVAYEDRFHSRVGSKPLTNLRIENLFTGANQEFELSGGEEFEDLYLDLVEASTNVRAAQTGERPPAVLSRRIQRFPTDADGQPVFWPRLPRDPGHCSTCSYVPQCIAWVAEHRAENHLRQAVRIHWQEQRLVERRRRMPAQLELVFPEGGSNDTDERRIAHA